MPAGSLLVVIRSPAVDKGQPPYGSLAIWVKPSPLSRAPTHFLVFRGFKSSLQFSHFWTFGTAGNVTVPSGRLELGSWARVD